MNEALSGIQQDDELKKAIDWFGGYLKESFPKHFEGSNPPNFSVVQSVLNEWKAEIGEIPEGTCPDIDKAIKKIDSAMELCKSAVKNRGNCSECENCNNRCETEDVAEYADDAYSELSGVEDILEELRADNTKLRELGEFWYEKCKELLRKQ